MAKQARFPWVAVSAVVAFVAVAAVAWLEVPQADPDYAKDKPHAGLELTRVEADPEGALLAEQLAAYDPAPMFIPSAMTSSAPALPDEARPEASGPFAAISPELVKTAPLVFPAQVPVPLGAVDGLRAVERADAPLALGRDDLDRRALPTRFAKVEAMLADTGRVVLQFELQRDANAPESDWQPLEFSGAVARSGLVGDLVLTGSSGSEAIDEYIRARLQKTERLGQRLPRGFYVIRVGP